MSELSTFLSSEAGISVAEFSGTNEIQDPPQFPLFSKLVVEIRLKIWRFAFMDRVPQVVAVSTLKHDCNGHQGWCPRYTSSPPPALVNVCIESRQIAYEEAVKSEQLHFVSPQNADSTTPGIIFNPLADTLYVPSSNQAWSVFLDPFPTGILQQVHAMPTLNTIRYLALNLNAKDEGMRLHDMGVIRSLEEITFVAEQLGRKERIAIDIARGFLHGMRERRRTRRGSYGDAPNRGNYPSIVRFARRPERSIEVMNTPEAAGI